MLKDNLYVEIEFKETVKKMYCTCKAEKTYTATDYVCIDNMVSEIYKAFSLDGLTLDFCGFFGENETYKTIARIYSDYKDNEAVYSLLLFDGVNAIGNTVKSYSRKDFKKSDFKNCVRDIMINRRNME